MLKERRLFGRPVGIILVVLYKVAWGVTEIMVGTLLLFSGTLIRGELVEDPQDLFVNWLLRGLHFDPVASAHFGWFLVFLGVTKFVIAAGVWYASWTIRRVLMAFLCLIALAAAVELARHLSATGVFGLVADLLILVYLWKFLPQHLRHAHSGSL